MDPYIGNLILLAGLAVVCTHDLDDAPADVTASPEEIPNEAQAL